MQRRYNLLGTYTIAEDSQTSGIMKSDKGCALMAVLITHGRPLRREYVADLLWDSATTAQSLTRLRVLMSRVRKWTPELRADRKQLSFAATPATEVDLHLLRQAMVGEDIRQVDEGLRLYKGDLLSGFYLAKAPRFNEWLMLERERLRQRVVNAYRQICLAYVEQEAWLKGVNAARRWLLLDELDEEALRYLLRLLASAGQIDVALGQYEHNRDRLRETLGVEPELETMELAQRLRDLKQEQGGGIVWDAIVGAQPMWPAEGELAEPGALPAQSYLPFQRNMDFTGRHDSLRYLAEVLLPWPGKKNQQRIVAITGMGGVGKTQLAVEFAYRYGRFFAGGAYWMSFAQADDTAEEIAFIGGERGMGLYKQAENLTLVDRVGRVQKTWQEAVPRLLIFDNCEDEALLSQWLPKTGGARVLLTSRRGDWSRELGIDQLPLAVLDEGESIAFLRRLLPDMAQDQAKVIAAEVGYLPLALHLAGGFLRRYPQITPAQYLTQLRNRGLLNHPSLQGRGVKHSPTGHELNVARTFALSVQQLTADDEIDAMAINLLLTSACFAPGEPITHALLRACVVDDDQDLMSLLLVEDGLTRLVVLGFLEEKGHRTVVLHHLLAAYTVQEMATGEMIRAAQSTAEATFVTMLNKSREQEGHLSILPMPVVHLSHLTENALQRKAQVAPQLATLFGHHLRQIGSYIEAEQLLKRAYALARETGDIDSEIEALITLANAQESLGQDEASLRNGQLAVELLKKADKPDAGALAEAYYRLGWAYYRLGQAQAALRAGQEGFEQSRMAQLPAKMAANLSLMGVVNYYLLGSYEDAFAFLDQGLTLYRELGMRNNEASVLNNMGENLRLQGDYERAAAYYTQALAIVQEINHHNRENIIVCNLSGIRLRLGDYERAAADLERLINRTEPDWFGTSEAYRFLAEAYLELRRSGQAEMMAQQALAFAHPTNAAELGRAWRVLGIIASETGQEVRPYADRDAGCEAPACFENSINFFQEINLERDRAISLWRWAQHELNKGCDKKGEELWQEACDLFKRLRLPLFLALVDQSRSFSELN
ncbi:MAG: tetratricopeptide repeat protein [Candidatus Promineifilaceae bacterium]|nr:tetratricopeptide repeat protein [Candidatus Promineifilaceae bacterium]